MRQDGQALRYQTGFGTTQDEQEVLTDCLPEADFDLFPAFKNRKFSCDFNLVSAAGLEPATP
jgi:hypothetical protein